jgi:hypothetical protein
LSPEDDFRQLAASNPLCRFSKMTYRGQADSGLS